MRAIHTRYRLPAPGLLWRVAALSLCVTVVLLLSGLVGCGTPVPTPTNTPTTPADTATPEAGSTPEEDSTPEATREPLVPLDDDPVLGSQDAPVTIIEYSEYLCPYCRVFALETLPLIEEEYIDTGKVKLIFRDFPVHGQPAVAIAMVAECAADQGKFWDMHMFLWERYEEWSQSQDILVTFQGYAEELGMDTEEFTSCLQEGTVVERIIEDYNIGVQDGVSGTPAFFINGTAVRGALPFEEFQKVIEEKLAESG
ncbi:MAG TPA: DsbA family protein [Anaerolineae bacterium]|nr:DsbA family protein [Anaerolineae bacterium]